MRWTKNENHWLASFFSKGFDDSIEYVRENNWGSIWIDEELVGIMKIELEKLDRFLMLMKQQPGLKVYFYDSY